MKYFRLVLALLLCHSILIGCATVKEAHPTQGREAKVKNRGHGPPPHAPAHGYRHKHAIQVELEFDSHMGVYVVLEIPGVYFHDGLYIRLSGGKWEVAAHFNGPWRKAKNKDIPSGLKKGKGAAKSRKGHGKSKKK